MLGQVVLRPHAGQFGRVLDARQIVRHAGIHHVHLVRRNVVQLGQVALGGRRVGQDHGRAPGALRGRPFEVTPGPAGMGLREEVVAEIVDRDHRRARKDQRQPVGRDEGHVWTVAPQRRREAEVRPQARKGDHVRRHIRLRRQETVRRRVAEIQVEVVRRLQGQQRPQQSQRVALRPGAAGQGGSAGINSDPHERSLWFPDSGAIARPVLCSYGISYQSGR